MTGAIGHLRQDEASWTFVALLAAVANKNNNNNNNKEEREWQGGKRGKEGGVSGRTEEVGASVLLSTWPRLICRQGHWSASETETATVTEGGIECRGVEEEVEGAGTATWHNISSWR